MQKDADITGWLKSRMETSWNLRVIASHMKDREFMKSLLALFGLLEPSYKLGVVCAILHLKKKDIDDSEEEIQQILNMAKVDNEEWLNALIPCVEVYVKDKWLDVDQIHSSYIDSVVEHVVDYLKENPSDFTLEEDYFCKNDEPRNTKEGLSLPFKPEFIVTEEERKELLDKLYEPMEKEVQESMFIQPRKKSASFLKSSKKVSTLKSFPSYNKPGGAATQGRARTMMLDLNESINIIKEQQEAKKKEKQEAEEEAERERLRKKMLMEERRQQKLEERKKKEDRKKRKQGEEEEEANDQEKNKELEEVADTAGENEKKPEETGKREPDITQLKELLFKDVNRITPADEKRILSFVLGMKRKANESDPDVQEIVMREDTVTDANTNESTVEYILFEMNYQNGSWRKLKRRKVLPKE